MPVKIRLQRKGRRKKPFYHIVIADARAKRDGKFIERIGSYNPMTKPATIDLDRDKAFEWLQKGAQPTDTVRAILRFKGVLYRKHLMRGVKKGALTVEQADQMYQDWIEAKEAKIAKRFEASAAEKAAFHAMVSGKAPPPEVVVEETPEVTEAEPSTEETAPAAEASAEANTEETNVEAPAEEPAAVESEATETEAEPAKEEEPAKEDDQA